jgi:hypothetical protein
MATFPALTPSGAPLTPGRWGGTQIPNLSGGVVPVRHSSVESGRGLALSFIVTRAQLYQIRDHYLGQLSNMDGFDFSVTTIPTSYTPSGSWWFYAAAPQVRDLHADYFAVEISVQSEPKPLFTISGAAFQVLPTLAAAGVTAIVPGATFSESPTLAAGGVTAIVPGEAFVKSTTGGDALFPEVQLLAHFDGSLADSSSSARTITNVGSVQFDSTHAVDGSAAYTPSGTRYLTISGGISIPSSTPATLEIWFRATSVADFGLFADDLSGNGQLLAVLSGQLYCYWNANQIQGGTVNANQNHRAAVTRDSSGIVRLFLDGLLVATAGSTNNAAFRVSEILRAPFRGSFAGWADEARITVGATACRYTSTYTPGSGPFPNAQTSDLVWTPGAPV